MLEVRKNHVRNRQRMNSLLGELQFHPWTLGAFVSLFGISICAATTFLISVSPLPTRPPNDPNKKLKSVESSFDETLLIDDIVLSTSAQVDFDLQTENYIEKNISMLVGKHHAITSKVRKIEQEAEIRFCLVQKQRIEIASYESRLEKERHLREEAGQQLELMAAMVLRLQDSQEHHQTQRLTLEEEKQQLEDSLKWLAKETVHPNILSLITSERDMVTKRIKSKEENNRLNREKTKAQIQCSHLVRELQLLKKTYDDMTNQEEDDQL